jgi:CheY-like chemotaxis protein
MIEFELSITILVVDSDEVNRRLLSETLHALGYEVLQATDVASGWTIVRQCIERRPVRYECSPRIDLVISDIFAPADDGLELLFMLKKLTPEIPVILMSSLSRDGSAVDTIELKGTTPDCDAVLPKPVRIERLEELISTILLRYDRAAIPRKIKTVESGTRHNKRILLVDDDPGLLEFMAEGMKSIGYNVEACGDTTSAVSAFRKGGYDLVVSDFMLSGSSSGAELIKELKGIGPAVPAIIVTGYPIAYPPNMARLDGIQGYLIKPFRINQLERVITDLLYTERVAV